MVVVVPKQAAVFETASISDTRTDFTISNDLVQKIVMFPQLSNHNVKLNSNIKQNESFKIGTYTPVIDLTENRLSPKAKKVFALQRVAIGYK